MLLDLTVVVPGSWSPESIDVGGAFLPKLSIHLKP